MHGVHEGWPSLAAYVPAEHNTHVDETVAFVAELAFPATHSVHSTVNNSLVYLPGGQESHAV
jgi:hypothetical protein